MSSPAVVWDDEAVKGSAPPHVQWDDEQSRPAFSLSNIPGNISRGMGRLKDEIMQGPTGPGLINQMYRHYTGKPDTLNTFPEKAVEWFAGTMVGAEAEDVAATQTARRALPPGQYGAPPRPGPMRALPRGQYEAPASPLRPPAQLGPEVLEGEYVDDPTPAPQPRTIRGWLRPGQYEQPASPLLQQLALPWERAPLLEQIQDWPPEGARYNPAAIPRAPRRTPFQDVREDQSIQDMGRADLDAHGIAADIQARREWFARNDPSTPKSRLIEQIGGTGPEKPVQYTSTSGVKYDQSGLPRLADQVRSTAQEPQPKLPGSDEDLTPLLEESLRRVLAGAHPLDKFWK